MADLIGRLGHIRDPQQAGTVGRCHFAWGFFHEMKNAPRSWGVGAVAAPAACVAAATTYDPAPLDK
jgi:hypothetical protein